MAACRRDCRESALSGRKKMKGRLGVEYTEKLRSVYAGRLAGFSDLVCYWFEKVREEVNSGQSRYTGLVATSSIRGGTNRPVLDKIADQLAIYEAWDEEEWTIEGANVEVSLVCFAKHPPQWPRLNGNLVSKINSDLTTGLDLTRAKRLLENKGVSFIGVQKNGPLDVPGQLAHKWQQLRNPNNRSNSEALRRYWNADDITAGDRNVWLIDFPLDLSEREAALFQAPFEYLKASGYAPDRVSQKFCFLNIA